MKLQFNTLLSIITAAALLGGFYYTTSLRLDSLEHKVKVLSKKVKNSGKNSRKGLRGVAK